jgi:hypothetical protein
MNILLFVPRLLRVLKWGLFFDERRVSLLLVNTSVADVSLAVLPAVWRTECRARPHLSILHFLYNIKFSKKLLPCFFYSL